MHPTLSRPARTAESAPFATTEWSLLVIISLILGSAFLWTAIALENLSEKTVAFMRIVLGAAGLAAIPSARRRASGTPVVREEVCIVTGDPHYMTTIDSQFGELILVATDRGLRAVKWPSESASRIPLPNEITSAPGHPVLRATRLQLQEYFDGQRTEFNLTFDLRGTVFQQTAWRSLASIPYGTTTTYGRQAARVGRPRAARAVGAANGRNPISIILPCHRVIGAGGDLVGFGAGIEIKRRLLAFEQINLISSG